MLDDATALWRLGEVGAATQIFQVLRLYSKQQDFTIINYRYRETPDKVVLALDLALILRQVSRSLGKLR